MTILCILVPELPRLMQPCVFDYGASYVPDAAGAGLFGVRHPVFDMALHECAFAIVSREETDVVE
eukprot:11184994-Lingulodinium_polyedra.AAC.1